jgi:Sulfotransferase family
MDACAVQLGSERERLDRLPESDLGSDVDFNARRSRWVPPPRPDWVTRFNAQGADFDLTSVIPLSAETLLATARANTGLDDFGGDEWVEPFNRLVSELDTDSGLNLMGRLLARQDLVLMLEARLRVEEAYTKHPEIEDEKIEAPWIIVGQGRTGTSALQNLLTAHPDNGTVMHWEAYFPCGDEKTSVARTDQILAKWNAVTPEIAAMREFDASIPTESIHIHTLTFNSPAWFGSALGQAPRYVEWVTTQRDPTECYRYEKRVLKVLQWQRPRKRWIMKSPATISHMPHVLDVYPDAGFIWTHRDPVRALASVVSIIGTLHWIRSDEPFRGGGLSMFTNADLAAAMISQPIDWLESGAVAKDRLCNVRYRDFMADPLAVVAQVYDFFGAPLSDTGRAELERYLVERPRSARPSHEYDTGTADEIALERSAFKAYQDYFDVESEL